MPSTRIRSSLLIWVILILSLGATAFARDPSLDVNQYAHTSWTLRSGTFRGFPKSLAQTTNGYLWLGSDFGIVRFDGMRFVPWEPPAGTRLPSTSVVKLLGTRDGSLWIGTVKGLARWKDRTLTHYAELTDQYITALLEDRDGTVWVGTGASPNGTSRLCAIRALAVRCEADQTLGRFVISLYQDTRGTLWVGAANGLWRWTPGDRTLHPLPDAFPEILTVTEDARGAILVVASRDIKRLGGSTFEPVPLPDAVRPLKATALLRDREGGLWIGTQDKGLVHLHQGRMDRFTRSNGLTGDFVSAFLEDAEKNVWVATLTGLDRFRPVAAATTGTRQGLSADTVLSVLAARDNTVWLGTVTGLNRWKDGQITQRAIPHAPPSEGVASLFEDSRGRLWVSSPRGLTCFGPDGSRAVSAVAKASYVYAMAEDGAGNLWVSDQERGLLQLREGIVVTSITWSTLGAGVAGALAADPIDGGLWLGFIDGGVAYFKDGRVQASYTAADGLGAGRVNHLRMDSNGALWAATEGGLSRVQRGAALVTLRAANGFRCDDMRWTIDDHTDAMWVYTTCALMRLPRAEIGAAMADPRRRVRMTEYDGSDGVPTHANAGSYNPPVAKDADGRLWFTSYEGAVVVDPRHLPSNVAIPAAHIEQITADGTTYEPETISRLPPLLRDLRIDYAATSLSAPEKIRFRYRLEGRDLQWVDAGNRRQAFYTDLAPGTYRFRAVAGSSGAASSSEEVVWSPHEAAWNVVIEPAFYQTTAFTSGLILIVVILGWSVYRARLARAAAQLNVRFEERLAERTRIAQELHDTLLQGVLSTSMQLHVVASQVTDQTVRGKIEHVLDRLRQVNGEGRQTLQTLRTQPTAKDDLGLTLARDAEGFRGEQSTEIRLVVEGTRQPLHPLVNDDVYRIAREALVNAFRHASAAHVEIQIEYTADRLRVTIRDDGCGIEPSVLLTGRPGHWGILGMRERAERIGASLRLMSAPGAGTELELMIPGRNAFQKPSSRKPRGVDDLAVS